MASFVVVGQNAEFFKHSITAELDSEVLRSTRSTSKYSWSKLGVLQSTPELLRSTHEYSGILSSTPEYSSTPKNCTAKTSIFVTFEVGLLQPHHHHDTTPIAKAVIAVIKWLQR
eukprot:scaffold6105_cov88-Skeletonema_dohrnii-CCMP3373.AAC.1